MQEKCTSCRNHWSDISSFSCFNNSYQQESQVLYIFAPNKWFGSLTNFIFLKTFKSLLPHIVVWFTDQKSKLLEIEDKICIILVIDKCISHTVWFSIKPRDRIFVKDYEFWHVAENIDKKSP